MAVLSREHVRRRFLAAAEKYGWSRSAPPESDPSNDEASDGEAAKSTSVSAPPKCETAAVAAPDLPVVDAVDDDSFDDILPPVPDYLVRDAPAGCATPPPAALDEGAPAPLQEAEPAPSPESVPTLAHDRVTSANDTIWGWRASAMSSPAVPTLPTETAPSLPPAATQVSDGDEDDEGDTAAALARRRRPKVRAILSSDSEDEQPRPAPTARIREPRARRTVLASSDSDEAEAASADEADACGDEGDDSYLFDGFVVPDGDGDGDGAATSSSEEDASDAESDEDGYATARENESDGSDDSPLKPPKSSKSSGKENTPPTRVYRTKRANPTKAEPSARELKAFKATREQAAKELYAELNQAVFGGQLPAALEIRWSVHLNTTAGRAHLTETVAPGGEQKSRNARIELSTKVLDRPDRLRSTLAHEMCHVAAWLIDGVSRPPHGAAFRAWATRVARHAKIEVTTCHRYEIAYRHTYVCTTPACGQTYGRHSKSIDLIRSRCGRCGGTLELQGKMRADGTPSQPRKENGVSMHLSPAFAAYVRTHLAEVRVAHPLLSQKAMMTMLAERYRRARYAAPSDVAAVGAALEGLAM